MTTAFAAGALTVAGAPAAGAAGGDVVVVAGLSTSEVVCGNVAKAHELARRRRVRIQRTNCESRADGGDVVLQDATIHLSRDAARRNRHDPVLAALAGRSFAQDTCGRFRRTRRPGVQLNNCQARSRGGSIRAENVKQVIHWPSGHTTTRRIHAAQIPGAVTGNASASCQKVTDAGIDQRDDCGGDGAGAAWRLHGVDVHLNGSLRRGVAVDVRGGSAKATIHCFNVAEGARVVQVNDCRARATGGNATLRNVTIHTYW